MQECKECQNRKLWAYRTYRVHKFISNLPKGPETGRLFNFSVRNIIRFLANKFIIGHMASHWYVKALKEGKEVYDYIRRTKERPSPSPSSSEVSRMRH